MQRYFLFLISGLLTLIGADAAAQAKVPPYPQEVAGMQCESYKSRSLSKQVRYCVHRSRPDLARKPGEAVVYFMHGIGGSSASWVDNGYAEALEVLRKEEYFPPISFVSFDTDGTSFFSDPGSVHDCADCYESWLVKEFIPKIEKELGVCAERSCRALAGISMGGLGAIKTALRYSQMFFMAAANSAAILPLNTQDSDLEWIDFFNRHPVGAVRGMALLYRARAIFSTREYASYNDSSWLVESFQDPATLPLLYFDVGGKDYFGFHEGFFRFKSALDARRFPSTSVFIPEGTHDVFWDRRWHLIRYLRDQLL